MTKRTSPFIIFFVSSSLLFVLACKKGGDGGTTTPPPPPPASFSFNSFRINGQFSGFTYYNINTTPILKFSFFAPVDRSTVASAFYLKPKGGSTSVPFTTAYENNDSTVVIIPSTPLSYLAKFNAGVTTLLKATSGGSLLSGIDISITTQIDSSRKFPALSDAALLDKVQQQTFKYFWDFGHPVSGLARERNTSGETVTSGGSGFGIMSIIAAVNRGFITRAQALTRIQTMASFLKNTAQKFHGAFPHWLNGTTGAVIPFSMKDNGADLVETSYLIMGLLSARQFFSGADPAETTLRNDINTIWNGVEWNWFRNGTNVLYWHWSPNYNFEMNLPIRGWNECLITYVLARSSTTHSIPASVYTTGWKGSANFVNGNTYYGYQLPLGSTLGGPLFFSHYSFMGINPNGLVDPSANYATQTRNHTLINYNYSKANPKAWFGYSDSVWGLTASDIEGGYTASSPTNDVSVIAPTAALSSMPYTPNESMAALKFFYYVLGDKIWSDFGFVDAFSLHNIWFASSYLAINQGPIIVMIENHRSGLLWNLFTSVPEVKAGMLSLGFTAPYL